MKKNHVTFLAVLMAVGLIGLASQAMASPQAKTPTPAPAHHGHEMKGAITAYDETAKTLKLKDSAGKEKEFVLTTATAIHGTLKVGEAATVRYIVKDAKDVATSIHVGAAKPAPAPAPATAPK